MPVTELNFPALENEQLHLVCCTSKSRQKTHPDPWSQDSSPAKFINFLLSIPDRTTINLAFLQSNITESTIRGKSTSLKAAELIELNDFSADQVLPETLPDCRIANFIDAMNKYEWENDLEKRSGKELCKSLQNINKLSSFEEIFDLIRHLSQTEISGYDKCSTTTLDEIETMSKKIEQWSSFHEKLIHIKQSFNVCGIEAILKEGCISISSNLKVWYLAPSEEIQHMFNGFHQDAGNYQLRQHALTQFAEGYIKRNTQDRNSEVEKARAIISYEIAQVAVIINKIPNVPISVFFRDPNAHAPFNQFYIDHSDKPSLTFSNAWTFKWNFNFKEEKLPINIAFDRTMSCIRENLTRIVINLQSSAISPVHSAREDIQTFLHRRGLLLERTITTDIMTVIYRIINSDLLFDNWTDGDRETYINEINDAINVRVMVSLVEEAADAANFSRQKSTTQKNYIEGQIQSMIIANLASVFVKILVRHNQNDYQLNAVLEKKAYAPHLNPYTADQRRRIVSQMTNQNTSLSKALPEPLTIFCDRARVTTMVTDDELTPPSPPSDQTGYNSFDCAF